MNKLTLRDADSCRSYGELKAVITAGSNEGAYIDILTDDTIILSYRYTCLKPDNKHLQTLLKKCNEYLKNNDLQGLIIDLNKGDIQ